MSGSILRPEPPRSQAPAPQRSVLTAPHVAPTQQILPPIRLASGPGDPCGGERRAHSQPSHSQTLENIAPRRFVPSQTLTLNTCQRLRDHSDEQVLSSEPIVRILVLRNSDSAGKAYEAFIYDGTDYAWVSLSASLNPRIVGDGYGYHKQLQIGSVAKLKSIIRPLPHTRCIGLVHDLEVVDFDASFGSSRFAWRDSESATSADPMGKEEHASRLLAEVKLQEERKRRVLLEGVLADVCRDLDSRNSLAPAAMQALKFIQDLADAASS
ncbi:hypothetical protein C8Q80DRAFT_788991 [Daedaleopsis nitida]|nr:hypothetical protein C8Q80DRAFT_788991 [Daedaleopsis nitida]